MLILVVIAVVLGLALAFHLGFRQGRKPKHIELSEPEREEVERLAKMFPEREQLTKDQGSWEDAAIATHGKKFVREHPGTMQANPPTGKMQWPYFKVFPWQKTKIAGKYVAVTKPGDDPTPILTPEKKV